MYFLFEVLFDLPTAEPLPAKHRAGRHWLGPPGPVLAQPASSPAHQTEQPVADISPCRQQLSVIISPAPLLLSHSPPMASDFPPTSVLTWTSIRST